MNLHCIYISKTTPKLLCAKAHTVTYSCAVCDASECCEMLSERDGLRGVFSAMAKVARGDGCEETRAKPRQAEACCTVKDGEEMNDDELRLRSSGNATRMLLRATPVHSKFHSGASLDAPFSLADASRVLRAPAQLLAPLLHITARTTHKPPHHPLKLPPSPPILVLPSRRYASQSFSVTYPMR